MSELKPCPFCGGSVRAAQQRGEGFEIACHCGASYSGMCASAEDLHRNWNRRAVLAQEAGPVVEPAKCGVCGQGAWACNEGGCHYLESGNGAPVVERQELSVWEGPMPESNGKSNFTVILHNGDLTEGICVYRSEYPDRARYEADCFRHLIGDPAFSEKPFICDYDADKHSGYVKPDTSPPAPASAEAIHDRAYRNGLMAGFQFGISGNEKGYAISLERYNAEINQAKDDRPAPVSHKKVLEVLRDETEIKDLQRVATLICAAIEESQ